MTPDTARSRVASVLQDSSLQGEIAQLRAKATLVELLGTSPDYAWSYVAPRLVRNATAALLDLEELGSEAQDRTTPLSLAARRIAEMWESLARLEESTSRQTALINAAAAYELAGYQANASCIARQLQPTPNLPDPLGMTELASLFLQRYFLLVQHAGHLLSAEPKSGTLESLGEAAAEALFGRGLSYAGGYFLSGSSSCLEMARESLLLSETTFAALGMMASANISHTLESILPSMSDRSTWTCIGDASSHPLWDRYLKLLARGVGLDVFRSPSVSELWPSQLEALAHGLLTDRHSKVIRMPTSAGKTRVAELAMAHTLIERPGSKCLFVAPYRALVAELEQTFLNLFSDLGFTVSTIIGTYESDDFEQDLLSDADVLVVTPEKLDLLLRLRPDLLGSVRLIVLDEGHLVDDDSRGAKFELLLTRLTGRLPEARVLFLSAVIPTETLQDFAAWFNAGQGDVVDSNWRPSVQRVAMLDWTKRSGVLRYARSADSPVLAGFVPGIVKQRTFDFVNSETGRLNHPKFPDEANKGQVAAELAHTLSEMGPVLVFCSQRNFAEAVGKALMRRLELGRLVGEALPAKFTTPDTRSATMAAEWLGPDHLITRLLKSGIAVHHGNLPDAVRKAVETDFRERRYGVIAATNTLAQGVNLPIRTVIVHSCWRTEASGARVRLPARDYWNIAGRAGRARQETEGTIIHLALNSNDERDYAYYLSRRDNVEPVRSALFQMLLELIDTRLTEAAAGETLDAEILALLVEEGLPGLTPAALDSLLSRTLVQQQAARTGTSTQQLKNAFVNRAQGIVATVTDPGLRRVYSATGLRTSSCEGLRSNIESQSTGIEEAFQAEEGDLSGLIDLFISACVPIPEMEPQQDFAGSYADLLTAWMSGRGLPELRKEFAADSSSAESLGRFVENFFGYLLPWGASAYLRIACHLLELDPDQLPARIRFFPSMVKFGVPFPEAAWAMAAGIPFRRIAIEIGSRFRQQHGGRLYSDFLNYVSAIESEDLYHGFGLRGAVLEDVMKAIARRGGNPLLESYVGTEALLPLEAVVKGVGYEERRHVARQLDRGSRVNLQRDYDNRVDRNAIEVLVREEQLGYLPRG